MQVVEWVLGPVRTAWESPDWQQRLASVDSFLECFAPMQTTPDGSVEVGALPKKRLRLRGVLRTVIGLPSKASLSC